MRPSRRTVMLAAALAPAGWGPARAAEASAAETVAAIYRRAAAGKGDSGGQFLWLKPKDRRAAFSKRTADLWDRAQKATPRGDLGPVDFDPVTNSQDPSLRRYDLVPEEDGPDRARVLVRLFSNEQPDTAYATLRYHVVREGGRWLIDDIANIAAGEDGWSLRRLIEAHLKSYGRR